MSRVLKRLLLFFVLPLGLLAGAGGLLGWLALRQFTAEKVVHQLEAVCNARVQLDGCSLSLFSSPARLELNGLHFHPRDSEADGATPPAGRPPIKIGNTYLRMRRGVVETDLAALVLRRELRVKTLLIELGDVKCDLLPSGENSLRELFRAPATVGGRANSALVALAPVAAAVAVATDTAAQPASSTPPAATGATPSSTATDATDATEATDDDASTDPLPTFHARELPGTLAVESIKFVDGRIRVRNRKSRAVTELNGLNLEITGLSVDPTRLADANRANVAFRSRVWIDGGKKKPVRLADLGVSVQGSLIPFAAATGLLEPDFQFTTVVAGGSTLQSLPALEKIEKNLARARRAGLKIDNFATHAVLAGDTTLPFSLRANQLSLTQPAVLDFTDYALALESGSLIDVATETHDVHASWVASQAISDRALAGAQEFLGALGDDVARELRGLLIDPVVKDGRLRMDFASKGELAKPEVRIAHPLQDMTDQLKEAGRGLIDGFKNK